MSVLRLGLLGWIAGIIAYVASLALLYGQGLSRGDAPAVLVSSLVAFAICYWALYLPVLRLVQRWLGAKAYGWVYVVVACSIGVVPTGLIARFYGGSWRALATPEAGQFFILFATVGVVLGLGFPYLHRRKS